MLGTGLGATIGKAMAALLQWLRLALGWSSWEAAATASLLLCRRLLRHALGDTDTTPWSELPPELLGLVLSRLPSQADRVRLRALFRPWRSADDCSYYPRRSSGSSSATTPSSLSRTAQSTACPSAATATTSSSASALAACSSSLTTAAAAT
ncbi:hypothetical protein QYE76_024147 [Lolium multiflorum]|uniref:F-box domain-containing protein n=1 Tax=Lolium multiflorum TaxID=4521 RepID=A0AAD8RBW0_LOLMU|nr:hypothetical protein QYE76_024147 [Lolium multiflorum]